MKKMAPRKEKSHQHSESFLSGELLDFLALFSHQLRTPLSVIKGYAAMFVDGSFSELSGDQKKAFEKILTSTERMVRLVNNFLDLPRIHIGTMVYNFEPMSLEKLLA